MNQEQQILQPPAYNHEYTHVDGTYFGEGGVRQDDEGGNADTLISNCQCERRNSVLCPERGHWSEVGYLTDLAGVFADTLQPVSPKFLNISSV